MTGEPKEIDALEEASLDALFEDMRGQNAMPSEALTDRILADADAHNRARIPLPDAKLAQTGWFAALFAQFGGGRGAAGLALAGTAGLMLGYMDMSAISGAAEVLGFEIGAYDYGDFYASFGGIAGEG